MSGFSTDEEYAPDTIDESEHIAQITKAVLTESAKREKMIVLRWTIIEDEQNGLDWREYIVCVAKWYGYGKLVKICRATGVVSVDKDPDGLDPLNQLSLIRNLLGKVCVVSTRNKKTEGNDGRIFTNAESKDYHKLPKAARKIMKVKFENGNPSLPDDAYDDFDGNPICDPPGDDGEIGDATFSDGDIPF